MTRRPNHFERERVMIPLDHPSVTATTTWPVWKVPTGKSLKIERVAYINPTGLTEDTTNVFSGYVRNSATNLTVTFEADTEVATSAAHGLLTGDGPFQLSNAGGALPTGLAAHTNYWIIKIDADTFYLASSLANALAGTAVAFTTDGTGTTTLEINIVARVFHTDSDLTPDIGATLGTTWIDATVSDANDWLAADGTLSFVATEGGTATLPAGRLMIEGYLY